MNKSKTFKELADKNQLNLYKNFPSTHFLSNPDNVYHTLLWITFFRRNLHRLATDYLGIPLYPYQAIMLYLMGICKFIVVIACRASAKSFLIALYACCRCITRPHTKFVICSATKGQSKLIVTEKIEKELMNASSMLRKEIKTIKSSQNETVVSFYNGSTIIVVPASENGRGYRSTCVVREEYRMIDKKVDDSIISPFQVVRQAPYMTRKEYNEDKKLKEQLQEEPVDIYISSSWTDPHWMWNISDKSFNDMMSNKNSCLLAFDESVVLKHGMKTFTQLKNEKAKQDPLTWRTEFENERVKENTSAFFTYAMLLKNQNLKKAFYPRNDNDVREKRKNQFSIPKQNGEIRIITCDMAFITKKGNDNSIFGCMRLLPESTVYKNNNGLQTEIQQGYRRVLPYIESHQGGELSKQALRIRQLYEDFEADYIVLDVRNGGIGIFDLLARVMYDEGRDCEYKPLTCMNDSNLANRIKIDGADPVIYAVTASVKLNSDIAISFRNVLENKQIDLLVNLNMAKEEILNKNKEYINTDNIDKQLFFEKPFLETQLLISETTGLVYEKKEQTGAIVISEQGKNTKDRYTSISYGSYFASLLEQDLLSESNSEYTIETAPSCVSSFNW